MKKEINFIIYCCFFLISYHTKAQESVPGTFVERQPDSLYCFYYDSQYYLTDKNCEFFSIKRITNYNSKLKTFDGPFTDYDLNGNIILTGAYKNGKKEGLFKSFFPGGFLNWQAEFSDGIPSGTWYYYYPDGRPLSILQIRNDNIFITSTWDKKGRQVVKDGNGKVEVTDPQFGFNEKGYQSIVYSGKVTNGLPDGAWSIYYVYDKGQRELAATEQFNKGRFTLGMLADRSIPYFSSKIRFAPTEGYATAESFISKQCDIDDYYNYTTYLSDYLTGSLSALPEDAIKEKNIEFTVDVNQAGKAKKITLMKGCGSEAADNSLLQTLYSIGFWIPSEKDGKAISDKLTVKSEIEINNSGKIYFTNTRISRSFGK